MKKLIHIKILVLVLILFLLGCGKKVTVTTIINKDGSCERVLKVRTDSIDFFSKEYPIPIDTTWNLTIVEDTTEKGKFIYTARKKFENISDLNELYLNDTGYLAKLDRSVELEKRFRWFYTFFTYNETYKKLFDQPSYNAYMTEKEMKFFKSSYEEQQEFLKSFNDTIKAKEFEDKVEENFFKWIFISIFNEYYQVFEEEALKLKDSNLSYEILRSTKDTMLKDTLFIAMLDDDISKGKEFINLIDTFFQSDKIKEIITDEYNPFKEVEEKSKLFEEIFLDENYLNQIEMPGLVIRTNSENNSSDTICWEINFDNYFTDDFEMIAESRIINKWAFYVSGIIVLFVITILITGYLRRR